MSRPTTWLLSLLLLMACQRPAPETTAVASMPAVTSDGVRIAYSSEGTGQPALVFVHGWALDRSYWAEQVGHFSGSRQTVSIDLAGHGESGSDRPDWSMNSFGRDVAAVIEGLELNRVILVGHSMGGSVVLEAARLLDEDRTAGIVLVDAFHDPDQPMSEEEIQEILTAYRIDFETNVGSMVRQYLFAPDMDSVLAERIVAQMAGFDPNIGTTVIENLFRSDYREALAAMHVPIAAVNSDLYPTNGESMARFAIEVRLMSGVGHFPMVEDPDEFNQVLEDVIRDWR